MHKQGGSDSWRTIQRRLAKKVIRRDSFRNPPKLVAGVDVAYSGNNAYSAAAVLDYETLAVIETRVSRSTVNVPYVPSFLAFRELKPLVKVIRRVKQEIDVFLLNSHGIAHPERCGCASHLGVTLDIPTIGVASRPLCGKVTGSDQEETRYLKDGDEIIGAAIVTRSSLKPIYISIGYKVSLISAIEIVRRTIKKDRMPEPLRLAHQLSNETRNRWADNATKYRRKEGRSE